MTSVLWLPDLGRSVDNLLLHKLRTLLTMLGMIFGVAAVVAMLSIGAGAQQQVMAFIEGLGVRNVIVEARETTEFQAYQKVRQQSPGLTFKDIRAMQATVPGLEMLSPRKRFTPAQVIPKPQGELPVVYGVEPNYQQIAGLKIAAGRFFTQDEASHAAPVCVLGEAARVRLFGLTDPLGQFVKVAGQWYQAIGGPDRRRSRRRTWPVCPGRIATTCCTCRPARRCSGSRTTTASSATRSTASTCG
jgi:putative ABC transport system permease protein